MSTSIILNNLNFYGSLIIALYIAAISHELGHGFVAYLMGDNTAKDAGRLSFNPLKHIDLVRTIIFPIILKLIGFIPLIMFKPVPINEQNFKNPARDSIKVALAGPGTNLLYVIISVIIINIFKLHSNLEPVLANLFRFLENPSRVTISFFPLFLFWFILINMILMTFNLLPIPPLDGSWVVRGLLPVRWRYYYQKSYTYLVILLFILVLSGKIQYIIAPVFLFFLKIFYFLILL